MENSKIETLLLEGEFGHAKLFHCFNTDNYVITSMKGSEGYYWNEEHALWKELHHSTLLNIVTSFLSEKANNIIANKQVEIENLELGTKTNQDPLIRRKMEELKSLQIRQLENQMKEFKSILKTLHTARHNKNVIEYLLDKYHNEKFMNLLNSSSDTLPIKNGKVINLKTLEIRDRIKADFFSHSIECSFVKEMPHANKFFSQIMCEDSEKLEYFQQCIGYSVTGETDNKCFFIAIGDGDNAKSATMEIIKQPFDKYYTSVQKNVLFSIGGDKQKDNEV